MLEKASVVGGAAAVPPRRAASAAARRTRSERPASSAWRLRGVPIAGPRNRRLGPLAWAFVVSLQELRADLQYADQDAMAHLRKKDRLLDHAWMIEGRSLAKTAALCGIIRRWRSLASLVSARPASDKPRGLRGNVSGRNLRSGILQGPTVRPAERREGAAERPGILAFTRTTFPSFRPRPEWRHLRRDLGPGRWRFGEPRPRRNRHAGQSSHRRWRQGDRQFARRAGIAFHTVPSPGKPSPRRRTCTSTTSTPITAVQQWLNRFNGVATKNLPNYLGWRRALEAGRQTEPPSWIKGAIGNGPYQQITL